MSSGSHSGGNERQLSIRTLTIASAASASAAALTSQLWIHGTRIAAAITPVVVALVSEALGRPAERLARTYAQEARPSRPAQAHRASTLATDGGNAAPVRIYRQPGARPSRPRLSPRIVLVTAALALVIAAAAITAGELLSGSSLAGGEARTTLVGGQSDSSAGRDDSGAASEEERKPAEDGQGEQTPSRGSTPPATGDPTTGEPAPPETTPPPAGETPTAPAPAEPAPAPTPTVP